MQRIIVKAGAGKSGMACLTAARCFLGMALFIGATFPTASGAASARQVNPAPAGDYVGADTCSDCHFAEFQQFQKTAMSVLLTKKYPVEQRGCEACHGPGRAHAEAEKAEKDGKPRDPNSRTPASLIYNFTRHSAKENAERCQ